MTGHITDWLWTGYGPKKKPDKNNNKTITKAYVLVKVIITCLKLILSIHIISDNTTLEPG